ncbi:hypothetical protein LVJ94_02055 [Pendulispora rubella]|uniref:PEGA domain-containing protein n=1 Tax=Pendulispora rubella TaxID=2741070 RepID=A0ABZ2L5A8_9BACT
MMRAPFLGLLLLSLGMTSGAAANAQSATGLPPLPASDEAPPATEQDRDGAEDEVPTKKVPVEFTANLTDITFHIDGEQQLCRAPCNLALWKGVHRIAVRHRTWRPIELNEFALIRQPSRVEATYTSREGTRWLGVTIGASALVVALLLVSASQLGDDECKPKKDCTPEVNTAVAATAGIVAGAGLIVTLALVTIGDKVAVNVVPHVFTKRHERAPAARSPTLDGGGLALQMRF